MYYAESLKDGKIRVLGAGSSLDAAIRIVEDRAKQKLTWTRTPEGWLRTSVGLLTFTIRGRYASSCYE